MRDFIYKKKNNKKNKINYCLSHYYGRWLKPWKLSTTLVWTCTTSTLSALTPTPTQRPTSSVATMRMPCSCTPTCPPASESTPHTSDVIFKISVFLENKVPQKKKNIYIYIYIYISPPLLCCQSNLATIYFHIYWIVFPASESAPHASDIIIVIIIIISFYFVKIDIELLFTIIGA